MATLFTLTLTACGTETTAPTWGAEVEAWTETASDLAETQGPFGLLPFFGWPTSGWPRT